MHSYENVEQNLSKSGSFYSALNKRIQTSKDVKPTPNKDLHLADIDSNNLWTYFNNEVNVFRRTGNKGIWLDKLYMWFDTIKPSNIEVERSFSHASLILTKQRNRLSIKKLNQILFLKYIYSRTKNS